jgi:hypothetical protein
MPITAEILKKYPNHYYKILIDIKHNILIATL